MNAFKPNMLLKNSSAKILVFLVLIITSSFYAQTTYTESGAAYGLDLTGSKDGGHAWSDFDNDGLIDVLVLESNSSASVKSFLMRQSPAGTFTNVQASLAPGMLGDRAERQAVWGDLNGDGRPDFMINSYGTSSGNVAIQIFIQNPTGTFGDGIGGTAPITVGENASATITIANLNVEGTGFFDFEGDGDLDIFFDSHEFGVELLRNNFIDHTTHSIVSPVPAGLFTHITPGNGAGVVEYGLSQSATDGDYGSAADVNDDGWVDIFMRKRDENDFFLNQGGTFINGADLAQAANANKGGNALWDLDNDGDLDAVWTENGLNQIYRNDGPGVWTPLGATPFPGLPQPANANYGTSSAVIDALAGGDVDNDGDIDILFVGNGRSYLYINQLNSPTPAPGVIGSGTAMTFSLDTEIFNSGQNGEGTTMVDIDDDGDLDIYMSINGRNRLYINDLPAANRNNHLIIDVTEDRGANGATGGLPERIAIGTNVLIRDCNGNIISGLRQVNGVYGHGTQSPEAVHFGLPLGEGETYVIEVKYPNFYDPVNGITRLIGTIITNPSTIPGTNHYSLSSTDAALSENINSPDAVDDVQGVVAANSISVQISLFDNDSEPDNEAFFIRSVAQPAIGSVVIDDADLGLVTYSYSSAIDFPGTTFTYSISDSPQDTCPALGKSDSATVTITIDSDNDGVSDFSDLDDDNDGILDSQECPIIAPNNSIANADFGANTDWQIGHNSGNTGPATVGFPDNSDQTEGYYEGLTNSNGMLRNFVDNNGNLGADELFAINTGIISIVSGNEYEFSFDILGIAGATSLGAEIKWVLVNQSTNTIEQIIPNTTFVTPNSGGTSILNGTWLTLDTKFTPTVPTGNYRLGFTWEVEAEGTGFVDDIALDRVYFGDARYCRDTDGDGIPDKLDLDSDDDGCPDALEGAAPEIQIGYPELNVDFSISGVVDANGIPTIAAGGQALGTSQDSASQAAECSSCDINNPDYVDTDGDLIANDCDLDDDNDGILDTDEGCFIESEDFSINTSDVTISLDNGSEGIVLDVTSLDNSFNIDINGVQLTSEEIEFHNPIRTVEFADGTYYGAGGVANIWSIAWNNPTDIETPLIRLIVNANGSVKLYGAKTWNGPLEPMVFVNGLTVNNISWNGVTNAIILDQIENGNTVMTGRISSLAQSCPLDTDGDGTANHLDLDSDNDGCGDADEGYFGTITDADPDNDGIHGSGTPTVDASGLVSGASYATPNSFCINYNANTCLDTDNDGVSNIVDLDDDNDGILDTVEQPKTVLWVLNGTITADQQNVVDKLTNLGYTVTIADDNDSQNTDNYSVTYVHPSVNSGTAFTNITNLATTSNGVITSENALFDEIMGTTGATGNPSTNLINITDNTHPITQSFPIGSLDIGSGDFYVNNVLSGTHLGEHPNGTVNLIAWEVGEAMDTGIAPGRRVAAPHTSHGGAGMNAAGQDLLVSAILWTWALDTDGDGTHDDLDLDSDNDGCNDVIEAGFTDDNGDGFLGPNPITVDSNGLVTSGSDGYTVPDDSNSSSIFDFQEYGNEPFITVQPTPATLNLCPGCSATFEVTATNTDGYQWQLFNGTSWVNLTDSGIHSGTGSSILTLTNVAPADNGNQYRVIVSNSTFICTVETSTTAILTVKANTVITNRRITHRVKKN